jgi:NAD(P)-binding Rossmann-like domain
VSSSRSECSLMGAPRLTDDHYEAITDDHFEAIVVGSGFGGAVAACRLAQAGVSVAVLERERRYGPGEFPRTRHGRHDVMDWRHGGPYDVRPLNEVLIVQGAGFGGGSLSTPKSRCDSRRVRPCVAGRLQPRITRPLLRPRRAHARHPHDRARPGHRRSSSEDDPHGERSAKGLSAPRREQLRQHQWLDVSVDAATPKAECVPRSSVAVLPVDEYAYADRLILGFCRRHHQ